MQTLNPSFTRSSIAALSAFHFRFYLSHEAREYSLDAFDTQVDAGHLGDCLGGIAIPEIKPEHVLFHLSRLELFYTSVDFGALKFIEKLCFRKLGVFNRTPVFFQIVFSARFVIVHYATCNHFYITVECVFILRYKTTQSCLVLVEQFEQGVMYKVLNQAGVGPAPAGNPVVYNSGNCGCDSPQKFAPRRLVIGAQAMLQ